MSAARTLAEVVGWLVIVASVAGMLDIVDFKLSVTPHAKKTNVQDPQGGKL